MFKNVILLSLVLFYSTNIFAQLENDSDSVFVILDKRPEFKGGDQAMYTFLGTHIDYPKEARVNGIEGKVLVQFIINKDGSIDQESVKAIGDAHPAISQEAVRVIKSMPDWEPGLLEGNPKKVRMVLPVFFRLNNVERSQKKKKKRRRG